MNRLVAPSVLRRLAVALILGAVALASPALAQANQRPISDWVNVQGLDAYWFGTNFGFPTDFPDVVGWAPGDDAPYQTYRLCVGDYAGRLAAHLATNNINLGTAVSGTVMERPLADGTAEVKVNVHVTNALVWVADILSQNPSTGQITFGPTLLGHRQDEVWNGAAPVLGEIHMTLVFINNAGMGAPLQDLNRLFFGGWVVPAADGQFVSMNLQIHAQGALNPDACTLFGVPLGTQGSVVCNQRANYANSPAPVGWDAWPVETVFLRPLGN